MSTPIEAKIDVTRNFPFQTLDFHRGISPLPRSYLSAAAERGRRNDQKGILYHAKFFLTPDHLRSRGRICPPLRRGGGGMI
jgi:hypothetical protein